MRIPSTCLALLCSLFLFAQAPEAFNYQAVARDAGGDPIANTVVGVEFQLHQTTANGPVVYTETHSPSTNELGLFHVQVGNGSPTSGTFSAIDWSAGPYFLEVGLDPNGGTSYTSMGTQQLLSVPYANYATDVQNKDDADADPANELQTIDFADDTLQLSQNGGKVDLSILRDDGDWVQSGDTLHTNGRRVGIGTTAPDTTLHIVGGLKYQDGTEGGSRVLTSDSLGNASWQSLGAQTLFGDSWSPAPTGTDCFSSIQTVASGSAPIATASSDDRLCVVNFTGSNLLVYDRSDPEAPVLLADIPLGGFGRAVTIKDGIAYVLSNSFQWLQVFDITSPTNGQAPITALSTPVGSTSDLAIQGDYLYITNIGADALMVFDISTPTNPVSVTSVPCGDYPKNVAIQGSHAVVNNYFGNSFITQLDLTNPAAPVVVGTAATAVEPDHVTVDGDRAYVVGNGGVLAVYDLTTPGGPTQTFSQFGLVGTIGVGVAARDGHLFASSRISNVLRVFDISDPDLPVLQASLPLNVDEPSDLDVSPDGYAYVSGLNSNAFSIFKLLCEEPLASTVVVDPVTGELSTQPIDGLFVGQGSSWAENGSDLYNSNTGNVGIGTTDPTRKLDVDGAAKIGDLGLDNTKDSILVADGDGNIAYREASSLVPAIPMVWSENASDLYNTNTGNVGIGTTDPTRKLDVAGAAKIRDLDLDNTKDSILVADGDGNIAYREASSLVPASPGGALGHVSWKRLNNNFTQSGGFFIFNPNTHSTSTTTSGGLSTSYGVTAPYNQNSGWVVPSDGVYAIQAMFRAQSTSSAMSLQIRIYEGTTLMAIVNGPNTTSGTLVTSQGGTTYLSAGDKVQFWFGDSGTGGAMNSFSCTITKLL